MKRLLIAEKPSVARDIGKVLGATARRNGCLEGPEWIVVWCIGHLVELVEPHEYNPDWKRWSLASLPMLPERFRLRPVRRTREQFSIVKRLLNSKDISEVVNGCDAGREGELIFRYVYELSGSRLPSRRLWVSSMTDEAIREGLAGMRPSDQFDRLFDAARCRSEADWLVGLNATRAITVRSRAGKPYDPNAPLFSMGRVQTPTLALIVDREHEIQAFVPEDYWQLEATFESDKGTYPGKWFTRDKHKEVVERFSSEAEACALRDKVLGQPGEVLEVERKTTREPPPLLFDLTRLQRTANKRYGFSAAKTLELAQSLYERDKLITYPRTDSNHLSRDMVPCLKSTISAVNMGPFAPFAAQLLSLPELPISKRIVDDSKVSDHHAIIPTPRTPRLETLDREAMRLYDLIVRRFLAAFYPKAVFDKTRIVTGVEGETFLSRGRVLVNAGWREVLGLPDPKPRTGGGEGRREGSRGRGAAGAEEEEGSEDEGRVLPPMARGDSVQTASAEVSKKQTQPPSRHTEATLLAAMERAGRLVDEEELQQAMKDRGLGTPATRAATIETLLKRDYIYRKRKTLMPTDKGCQLVASVPVEGLRSPQLTGEWEARLARMARGDYASDRFMTEVREYVSEIVARIKTAPPIEYQAGTRESEARSGGARGSGEGSGKAARRSRRGASARTDRKASRAGSNEADARALRGGSRNANGDISGSSSTDGDISGSRSDKKRTLDETSVGRCPRCSSAVVPTQNRYECERRDVCGFSLRGAIASKRITPSVAKTLLEKGKTRMMKGFVSPHSGVPFSARLLLKPNGGVGFEFKEIPAGAGGATSTGNLGRCPLCRDGDVIPGRRAWGCSRWRSGCRFVLPFVVDGIDLNEHLARDLIRAGRAGPVSHAPAGGAPPVSGVIVLSTDPASNQARAWFQTARVGGESASGGASRSSSENKGRE